MSGDENDRGMDVVGKLALEIQAVDVRQLDIEQETRRQIGLRVGDIFRGTGEQLGSPSQGLQQLAERLSHSGVVVYNEDDFLRRVHDASYCSAVLIHGTAPV